MAKVRLTIQPGVEREIPDDEIASLRSQGLIVEDQPAKPAAGKAADTPKGA